jgi:hypothetical protein
MAIPPSLHNLAIFASALRATSPASRSRPKVAYQDSVGWQDTGGSAAIVRAVTGLTPPALDRDLGRRADRAGACRPHRPQRRDQARFIAKLRIIHSI